MINSVVVAGNMGKDAELITSEGGINVTRFSIAVNEIRGKGDEKKTTTHWIDCVAFGTTAEAISKFTSKGSKITVQGRLNQRKWESQEGQILSRIVVVVDRVEFMSRAALTIAGVNESGEEVDADVTQEAVIAEAA
jgi:single-strand DNA-binding protein